jgi:peptide chain release factor 2
MKAKPKMRVVLRKCDLIRQTFRSGGPGGQHQNKTESGVRYIHAPSGVAAEARSDRSQHVNDAKALEMLEQKLLMLWLVKHGRSAHEAWASKPDVAFGAQMRSYVLAGNAQRVQDHYTGHEEKNPRAVLSGAALGGFIRAAMEERARQEIFAED